MFSFRSDKVGFFVTIILLVLLGAAVSSTVVILLLGSWERHSWAVKLIWGTWWVLCIITVLTRLAIFRYQMRKMAERIWGSRPDAQSPPAPDADGSPGPQTQLPGTPTVPVPPVPSSPRPGTLERGNGGEG